jgi:hypothetical protein
MSYLYTTSSDKQNYIFLPRTIPDLLISTYFQIIQVYIPHSVFTCNTEYVHLVGMLMENFAIFATLIFSLTIQQALGKRQRALNFL